MSVFRFSTVAGCVLSAVATMATPAVAADGALRDNVFTRHHSRAVDNYCFFLRVVADQVLLFPEWEANNFDSPPAAVGPYAITERVVDTLRGADNCLLEMTVFEPQDLDGAKPLLVWVQGSNVQPYYQQSLHETLASWGYVVVVPDTRPLTIVPDSFYHLRNTVNGQVAIGRALSGDLGVEVDPEKIAAGGYSIGATMTTFLAARDSRVKGSVLWAPTTAPFWTGVDPDKLYPGVTSSVHFLLGELDDLAGDYPDAMQAAMINAAITVEVIEGGTHLYFMQPTGADDINIDPPTDLTRFEQQGIAIEATRSYLDGLFGTPAR